MNNGWSEERDSFDTLCVPFVWVPDGAPEPIEWLAEHPDAFWVPATLVRGESSDHGLEVEPDSSDNDDAGYASEYPADGVDSLRTEALPSSAGGPDAAGSAAFAGSRYGQEDPIAVYLRIDAMFARLGVGSSAAIKNTSMPLPEPSGASPVPSRPLGAYAHPQNDPHYLTEALRPCDNPLGYRDSRRLVQLAQFAPATPMPLPLPPVFVPGTSQNNDFVDSTIDAGRAIGNIFHAKPPANPQPITNSPQPPPPIPEGWVSSPSATGGGVIHHPPGQPANGPDSIRVMPPGSSSVPGLENGYWRRRKGKSMD